MTRSLPRPLILLAAVAALAGGAVAAFLPAEKTLRPAPADPRTTAVELLEARPFVLDAPEVHHWRAEQPTYRAGYVLVLRTDPELVRARQTAEPVLYVGDQTAQKINHPDATGNLVALVPAPLDGAGGVALDLANTPIWFGAPGLPEQVTADTIAAERVAAEARRVGPPRLSAAFQARRNVEMLYARDRADLDLMLADLVEFYSPDEGSLVEMLRLPVQR